MMEYYPPGPVASAFMHSDAFVTGLMGPIGSGKTTACIAKCLDVSMQQPLWQGRRRARGAIIRNTYPELRTTTMNSWFDWMPKSVGHWKDEGPPTHTIDLNDLWLEVIFLALDRPEDIRKLLSLELTWAWMNEAREQPKIILDGLTGRVGRFPPVREGGCINACVVADTNPPDSDHWWYTLAEGDMSTEEGRQLVESTKAAEAMLRADGALREDQPLFRFLRQPSGLSPDAENLENLPTGYYAKAMAGKSEEYSKVYVRGEYGFVLDGKPIYPEYIDSLHCRAFELVPGCPIRIGLDFGLTPAATISARDMRGRWRVRDELVTEDMGATKFAIELGKLLREKYATHPIESNRGDPAGDTRVQTDEETVFKVLRANNIIAQPAPTNDFTIRRDAVGTLLTTLIDGEPAITIHPDCRVLRKGMAGAYNLRRLKLVGQERYEDKPSKNRFSHVCEALQYDVVSGGEGKAVVQVDPKFRLPMQSQADIDYPTFTT